jgi:hypothetical protein
VCAFTLWLHREGKKKEAKKKKQPKKKRKIFHTRVACWYFFIIPFLV